jgi:hypothetical protein
MTRSESTHGKPSSRITPDHDLHQGRQPDMDFQDPLGEGLEENEWMTLPTASGQSTGAETSGTFEKMFLKSSQVLFSVTVEEADARIKQSEAPTPPLRKASQRYCCESTHSSHVDSCEDVFDDVEWEENKPQGYGVHSSTDASAHLQHAQAPHQAEVLDSEHYLGDLLLQRWCEKSRKNAQAQQSQCMTSTTDLMVLSIDALLIPCMYVCMYLCTFL